jgi:hypothetical protein
VDSKGNFYFLAVAVVVDFAEARDGALENFGRGSADICFAEVSLKVVVGSGMIYPAAVSVEITELPMD